MKPTLKKIHDFPFRYYQYGSTSSTDLDVIIEITKEEMPLTQEERKIKLKQLMLDFELNWNAIFVVIEDGVLVDTIYTKSWIDSLNNAFYHTYKNHKQFFDLPIKRLLKRNKTLAIYKAVRTVLTMLTRTDLRVNIKPILKGIHSFSNKIDVLKILDFTSFNSFNQKNTANEDVWKILAFYIAQNILLLSKNKEVYSKEEILSYYPQFSNFINRKVISVSDKQELNILKDIWIKEISNYGNFTSDHNILKCNEEVIDMVKEVSLNN
ncbi:hypothetical protein ACSIGC_02445 [Tenacibaculum sp. ZS6-P6]|uniref:hypothetical protein n=1 Tax=Tenacibaculum sp. ZS6-P6 TaxID=3447503 RepID=UPI003F9C28B1